MAFVTIAHTKFLRFTPTRGLHFFFARDTHHERKWRTIIFLRLKWVGGIFFLFSVHSTTVETSCGVRINKLVDFYHRPNSPYISPCKIFAKYCRSYKLLLNTPEKVLFANNYPFFFLIKEVYILCSSSRLLVNLLFVMSPLWFLQIARNCSSFSPIWQLT